MVEKRHFRDHEGDDRDPKRKPFFRSLVEDLARGPSINEAEWERFLRRVVQEEVEKVIRSFNASPGSHLVPKAGPSGGGSGLELRFVNKVPPTIFTGSRIEPEDQSLGLQIVLFNTISQTVVKTGPLSLAKVEIVALNGEFGADDQEDWTEKQFNDSVLREREGRRPLVTGELTVMLCEGVGFLSNVIFTDNSSWIRSRKFRLGVRIAQRNQGEMRVREARSEPFVVKDHRGELYRKHYPPQLRDEVWRLEKIAKEGAFHSRLAASGITTVQEFLQLCIRDPATLRNILGGLSKKTWNAIVDHAMTCVVDDNRFFVFHHFELSVVFNSIYKVVGASFNGQILLTDALTPSQKILVENLKQQAYSNIDALVPVDGLPIALPPRPIAEPYNDPQVSIQYDFPVVRQEEPPAPVTQPNLGPEVRNQLVVPAPQPNNNNHPVILPQTYRTPSFSFDDFLGGHFNGEPSWPVASSSQMPFIPENLFHFQGTSIPSAAAWNEQGPCLFFTPNNREVAEEEFFPGIPGFIHMSRDRKGKARWSKVRTALKCLMSFNNAAKMSRQPLYLSY